ncbi:hypothetical protein C0991_010745 [Blastosporella zonata]|nr:hypothetical protein C0991_010745 [Blastosporella zonata]
MAAMFNFIPELPPVLSTAEKPDLEILQLTHPEPPIDSRPVSVRPQVEDTSEGAKQLLAKASSFPADDNSATEESDGDGNAMDEDILRPSQLRSSISEAKPLSRTPPAPRLSPIPPASGKDDSDSDSSPVRPGKKLKKPSDLSDDDSEGERKRRVAQLKGGSGAKRGTRQPIKRGGKRF